MYRIASLKHSPRLGRKIEYDVNSCKWRRGTIIISAEKWQSIRSVDHEFPELCRWEERWRERERMDDCKTWHGATNGNGRGNPLLTFFWPLRLICGYEVGLTGRKEAIGNEGSSGKIKEEINSFLFLLICMQFPIPPTLVLWCFLPIVPWLTSYYASMGSFFYPGLAVSRHQRIVGEYFNSCTNVYGFRFLVAESLWHNDNASYHKDIMKFLNSRMKFEILTKFHIFVSFGIAFPKIIVS